MLRMAVLILLLSSLNPSWASEPMASKASVLKLLDVTQSQKLLDGMMAQIDSYMQKSMKHALAGKKLTPKQQDVLNDMKRKLVSVVRQEMRWESLQPAFVSIYRQSFTEKEVEGMIAFYKTPVGQAVINKKPLVMKRTMAFMQMRMQAIMPKVRAIQRQTVQKLENGG